jgi:diguanylate cyclase (GGDEF)-like protein/PAS domain S-box-containing protein
MNSAAIPIPAPLEARQALRLQRFGVAALGYLLATALVAIAWSFGVLPGATVLEAAAAFLAINLGLYAVIRSGFNLRFADPSLTRIQMLAAITVLMYIVYHMDGGREAALFGCFVVFLFGVFRLKVREFVFVTLYTLAAYALVIVLLMRLRPQAIHDLSLAWMSWLALAGFLPCFNIIGGQINALRRRMRASEARFRTLTEMSSDFYWESDAEHRLTDRGSADRNVSSVSVFRQGAQIGERRWEIPYLSPDEAGWRAHRAVLEAHRPFRDFELSRLGTDGSEHYISISGDPVFDDAGAFKGYRGVGTDITARKRSEQALRDAAEELRLFAENVPTMTIAVDENLRCIFANKAYAELFGLGATDAVGMHLREIVGQDDYREIEGHVLQALQGRTVTYQRVRRPENREARHLEVKLVPYIGDQGKVQACFAVVQDITEHKLAEERIQRVAHHDSLTGLPNRLLFNDRLAQAMSLARRDSRQFALLYLDLDRFKPVNDVLGHAAGDELLKDVATRIRQQVRESDTVARIGGDEFTVILQDVAGREDAETVAGKIRAALAAPFAPGGEKRVVEIGASIGIALFPADGGDADALIKAADAAMYRAKPPRLTD